MQHSGSEEHPGVIGEAAKVVEPEERATAAGTIVAARTRTRAEETLAPEQSEVGGDGDFGLLRI